MVDKGFSRREVAQSLILSNQFLELGDLLRLQSAPTDLLVAFSTWWHLSQEEKLRIFTDEELKAITKQFTTYGDFYQELLLQIASRHKRLPMAALLGTKLTTALA
jgi:hypothetical protein